MWNFTLREKAARLALRGWVGRYPRSADALPPQGVSAQSRPDRDSKVAPGMREFRGPALTVAGRVVNE